ncbi:hypothetical protein SteCoe_18261 [Stentor coeruleus]|uniref:EF-hand domain-containing protein n=1 Tax=Stentor coeruleus TaxID=5963 RepID=A0A1R2BWT2_9CILI|nr:hypothetical protein SteCoe_18261 [Stentor coeruleus]
MGCSCSRETKDYEGLLQDGETLLPYSEFNADHMLEIHKRQLSKDHKFTEKSWNKIASDLKFDPYDKCKMFYESFKTKEGNFLGINLTVLSIMMSKGSIELKSRYIFELYDWEKTGFLKESSLENLISVMLDLAIEKFPLLCKSLKSNSELAEYISGLQVYKQKSLKKLSRDFLKDLGSLVAKESFTSFFTKECNRDMLTPTGLRLRTKDIGFNSRI